MAKGFNLKTVAGIGIVFVTAALAVYMISRRPSGQTSPNIPPSEDSLRIVSLAPNLTEILFAMGLEEHIIAVSSDSNYPPATEGLPRIGTFWQPDMEAIIVRRPSLVITLGFQQQAQMGDKLRSMGIETLTVDIESLSGLITGIEQIGLAVDKPEASQLLIDHLQDQIQQFRERYAGRDRPRVLWVIQRSPLRAAGVDTFVTEMLDIVGAQNAVGPTLHQYPPIDAEQVLAARPDVIIEPVDKPAPAAEARKFYSLFQNVPAVQNDRICLVDADRVSRLGPRLAEGLKLIAECIWPEEFLQEQQP